MLRREWLKTLPLGVGAFFLGRGAAANVKVVETSPVGVTQGPSEMMTQDKDGARRFIYGVATEDAKQGGLVWVQVSGPAVLRTTKVPGRR